MTQIPAAESAANGGPAASWLGQLSWAIFEGGRNPYVLLITIYIFAPYFTTQIAASPAEGQAILSWTNGISGLLIAVLAPILGAIADGGLQRKPWIAFFIGIMAPLSFALWWVMPDGGIGIIAACVIFVIIGMAFEFSAVFHNTMLPGLAPHGRLGALSGLGLALGNGFGVVILMAMLVGISLPGVVDWPFVAAEPWFGLDKTTHQDARIAGPIAAICMTVFTIPLLLFTPDRVKTGVTLRQAVDQGLSRLWGTIRSLRKYKNIALYLLARMFYNDGKSAVLIYGGVYAAGTFRWDVLHMLIYGVVLSIFATFGGVFGGWLDDRLGSQRAILVSIGGTMVGLLLSLGMSLQTILYVWPYAPVEGEMLLGVPFFKTWPEVIYLGVVIILAIFITAAYANSRTMLARIAPPEKMTEFFGLYALSGSSTTFLASGMVGLVTWWYASQWAGMMSIMLFLVPGFLLMIFVRQERAPL